jgi:hypothetical protein
MLQATVLPRNADFLDAQLAGPNVVTASYKTLPGNRPAQFENVIAVWPGRDIPWGQPPLTQDLLTGEGPDGDMVLMIPSGSAPPLIVAYGTSPTGKAYCATSKLEEAHQPGTLFITDLCLHWVGNDSLVATFQTPFGNQPNANENWLGLWEGKVATYDGSNRIAKVAIEADVSSGSQPMNDLTLKVETEYTLGYGCGPRDADLAATLTFKTDPFLLSFRAFVAKHGQKALKAAYIGQLLGKG